MPRAVSPGRTERAIFDFLVDTGATWVGIPQADIDALGLDTVPNASAALMMADGTIKPTPIYIAVGMLEGDGLCQRSGTGGSPDGRLQAAAGFGVQGGPGERAH